MFKSRLKEMQNYFDMTTKNINTNLEDYDLEQELEKSKMIMNNDNEINDDYCSFDNLENNNRIKYIYRDNTSSIKFTLDITDDIVQTLFLQIDKNDNLQNLYDIMTQQFLNSQMKIYFGTLCVYNRSLLLCIFEAVMSGYTIKENDSCIQIPLFIFDHDHKLNNDHIIKGLPIYTFKYYEASLYIKCDPKIDHLFKKISQKGSVIENKIKSPLTQKHNLNILYDIPIRKYEIDGTIAKINVNVDLIGKALILVFYPKDENTIKDVSLLSISVYNDSICDYTDNIFSFDIFDKMIYVVPFSKEFSSLEHIQNFYKDKHNNMTNQGIINPNFEIETSEDLINYNLDIMILNIQSFELGREMCIERY